MQAGCLRAMRAHGPKVGTPPFGMCSLGDGSTVAGTGATTSAGQLAVSPWAAEPDSDEAGSAHAVASAGGGVHVHCDVDRPNVPAHGDSRDAVAIAVEVGEDS